MPPKRTRKDFELPKSEIRQDGWLNTMTGLGGQDDKKMFTRFVAGLPMTAHLGMQMYHGDDICKRICEIYPTMAMRGGYDLKLGDDQDVADNISEINDEACDLADQLGLDTKITEAGAFGRASGGGVIFLNVQDNCTDLTAPLELERVKELIGLTVFDARYAFVKIYNRDILSQEYGQPLIWTLMSPYGGKNLDVHCSRVVILGGSRTGQRERYYNYGFDYSVFYSVQQTLKNFNLVFDGVATLMTEASLLVHKMEGLNNALGAGDAALEEKLVNRARMSNILRAVGKVVPIDSEEEMERLEVQFAGMPDILDQFKSRLSAAADIEAPVTVLFGDNPKSPGLNATGDASVELFFANVGKYQVNHLEPALKRIYQVMFAAMGHSDLEFSIQWKPINPNAKAAEAALRKSVADTDIAYCSAGILDPLEVRSSRFGSAGYSIETTLDDTVSKMLKNESETEGLPQVTVHTPEAPQVPDVQVAKPSLPQVKVEN